MTNNQTEQTRQQVQAAIEADQHILARWIQDPFASALLATAATSLAVCFVLGGMYIINSVIY